MFTSLQYTVGAFFILKERVQQSWPLASHTLVFSLKAWQKTSRSFPFEPFRNMSRAHNEAKLLFLYHNMTKSVFLVPYGKSKKHVI
ncbi:MAG: hypothetical protein CVU98_04040 [Firmicutes bacterium HGW-Firmicutes-3]|nr:MAG: hypothetical protein CVU98_04040 [Firmicutes bacterium HGW-Firmicutes-3]